MKIIFFHPHILFFVDSFSTLNEQHIKRFEFRNKSCKVFSTIYTFSNVFIYNLLKTSRRTFEFYMIFEGKCSISKFGFKKKKHVNCMTFDMEKKRINNANCETQTEPQNCGFRFQRSVQFTCIWSVAFSRFGLFVSIIRLFTMRFNVIYLLSELLNGLQNEIEKKKFPNRIVWSHRWLSMV